MKHIPVPIPIFHNDVVNSGHKLSKPSSESSPPSSQHMIFSWKLPELQPLLPNSHTVERSADLINQVGCSMSSYLAKMPTLARQATSFVANLFTGASPSTKVGSVDPVADSKPTNGMTPTVQNGHANGDLNHMRSEETGTTRTRSMDSDKIVEWEPSPDEKELIKQTWSDDFSFLYELGSNIYIYIFTHFPEAKKLFPTIHQHGEKYRESKEFRSQALKFVQAISHSVKNIYHMNDLAPYLSDIGRRHVKFAARGFKPEYWDIFLDAMEFALTDQINSIKTIDDERRAKALQVWRRLAFYIITHLKRGFFAEMDDQNGK